MAAYKVVVTANLAGETSYQLGVSDGYARHAAYIVAGALYINYGSYGFELPYVLLWTLIQRPDPTTLVLGTVLSLAVGAYVATILRRTNQAIWTARRWLALIGAGVAVFALGYAVFLTNENIMFSSTSIDNRVALTAAAGVAVTWVGAGGLLACRATPMGQRRIFGGFLAVACFSCIIISNLVASYWAEAYQLQTAVLTELQRQIPALAPGSTILLDGVCPEVGPGIVFLTHYDLAGALVVAYKDQDLRATVVTAERRIGDDELAIKNYRTWNTYRYGENLVLYNRERGLVYRLTDAERAREYFRSAPADPREGCPRLPWK